MELQRIANDANKIRMVIHKQVENRRSRMLDKIRESAEKIQEELVSVRRELHKHPELGFDLSKTKALLKKKLIEYGYEPKDCGQSGIVVLVGKPTGKTFLIRGDMDALPMPEFADIPYKSEEENKMHSCGHDLHATMLLGAAKVLKEYEDELEGQVKILFQPAEEILSGAMDCIQDGLLENPKVDAGMMLHVFPAPGMPTGTIITTQPGVVQASADWFEVNIRGKGGHGAMPETAIDPINVAVHIYTALQAITAREVGSEERFVLTIGEFIGGSVGSSNVIPGEAYFKGTLRALNEEVRSFVKERIVSIAQNIAKAFRAEVEVVFTNGCCANTVDENVFEFSKEAAIQMHGADKVLKCPYKLPLMSSEDFGEIGMRIPATVMYVAAGESPYPVHNSKVVFDEAALKEGVKTYAYTAYKWLQNK